MSEHIQLFYQGKPIKTNFIEFSDGAVCLQVLEKLPSTGSFELYVNSQVPIQNILQELAQFNQVLAQEVKGYYAVSIHFDYHPYARADRQFNQNEPWALKTFIDAVVSIVDKLETVTSIDTHSAVTKQLWKSHNKTFLQVDQLYAVLGSVPMGLYEILCAPDKGAVEKAKGCKTTLAASEVIQATKVRSPETGKILETRLPEENTWKGKNVLIVDDICDGGGTFLPLASMLKQTGARKVSLYVTHGIFCKGLTPFIGLIDTIYCCNIVGNYITQEHLEEFNKGKQ